MFPTFLYLFHASLQVSAVGLVLVQRYQTRTLKKAEQHIHPHVRFMDVCMWALSRALWATGHAALV